MLLAGKISAVCGKHEDPGANEGGARNAGVVRGGKRLGRKGRTDRKSTMFFDP